MAHPLLYGVPQGSVLGPVLFSLYMAPLESIIIRHGLDSVIYADDSQLYIACDSRTDYTVVMRIEACVDEIRGWMRDNMLALNDGKTEVIWFSSRFKDVSLRSKARDVRIGGERVSATDSVRSLGVTLNSTGTMDMHITTICRSASYALWRIGRIRKLLDQPAAEKLVHAFVTSRLDYCNSLLYGCYAHQLKKLQHLQNAAARMVICKKLPRNADISPFLRQLHWLPIEARVLFKVVCIIFKIIHSDTSPIYLRELISVNDGVRRLRNTEGTTLCHPNFGKKPTRAYGDRAFAVYAPLVWNSLPVSLRILSCYNSFKITLKTHLFRKFYQ